MDAQQQQYFIFAIVGVVIAGVVSFVLLSQKKPKLVKADTKPTKKAAAPIAPSASVSSIDSSAAPAASKPKKKRSKSKAKNVSPVEKMDDANAADSEDEDETPQPVKVQVKEAPKPKKTAEEKAIEEILRLDDKKTKEKKKLQEKKKNGAKSPVPPMEDNPPSPGDSGDEAIFVNTKKSSAQSGALDGWAVVEKKKAKKVEPAEEVAPAVAPATVSTSTASAVAPEPAVTPAAEAPAAESVTEEEEEKAPALPPAPVIETVTAELTVEAKRLGLLIGVKGATRIAIQTATDTNIQMPKTEKDSTGSVTITVTGVQANVDKAIYAMKELIAKGYAMMLAEEDFRESDVTVHPRFLPDIIGKGGAVIRALGSHTGVKITVPNATKAAGPDGKIPKVKIGLAGPKEKVALCRNLVKELTKYYHTAVTHPGLIHEEMEIDSKYYNFIIGAKGSEIKHIQNSYKVSVHIPDADSLCPNVLIVGEEANVGNAKRHIEKLIEKVNERNNPKPKTEDEIEAAATAAALAAAAAAADGSTPTAAATEDGEESWLKELVPPTGEAINMDMAFPATISTTAPSAPIGLPPPASKADGKPAWNTLATKTW